ncbi:hypothetical protein BK666_18165 [Pseudomonas frederiksbergensis]|uniref:Uncharacterized protein n=1 Tax=Pseudomonas frederiksbergensis TaxID=104087 RepID=A0A423K117_9PSED|nr:hypothetical protein BK666_18165 [Pseudomonas frederiksbergensis]
METKSDNQGFPALPKLFSKIMLLSALVLPLASQAADDTYNCNLVGVPGTTTQTVQASSVDAAKNSFKSQLDSARQKYPNATLECVKQ